MVSLRTPLTPIHHSGEHLWGGPEVHGHEPDTPGRGAAGRGGASRGDQVG